MARITGLTRRMGHFRHNKRSAGAGRIRKGVGGRKSKETQGPTLLADLKRPLEPVVEANPLRCGP
jgi:hypothetical protein